MKRLSVLVVGVASLLGAAVAQDNANEKEIKKFEGRWKMVRAEESGRIEADPGGNGMLIEEDTIQFLYGGDTKGSKAKFSVDVSKDPKHIDVVYTDGSWIGKERPAIYRFTKDGKLEIAWGELASKKRPKKFTGKLTVGAASRFEVFKLVKDDE